MHEALSLLIDLEPSDIELLFSAGFEREVHREDVVLTEGLDPDHLFVVLEGVLEARLEAMGGSVLSTTGPGEVLGEVSWLEERPASATVVAIEDGVLLAIPRERINALITADSGFSARLYRSVGRCVARRLRARSHARDDHDNRLSSGAAVENLAPWVALKPAISDLKALMIQAEEATTKNGGTPPQEYFDAAHAGLGQLCEIMASEIGEGSSVAPTIRDEVGSMVRRELHPYLMLTRIVQRIYTKPRGYAGDFQTIEWMYRNEVGGTGAAGPLIDSAFLERPAARAVRNRRGLLAVEVGRAVERGGKVTSLACGPAEELFDTFASLDDPAKLSATCIDIDLQALALVSDRCDKTRLKRHVRLEQGNLVYLATGRSKIDLKPQDLIYSIGLIDYFQDRFVIALLDWIHDQLKPGGEVVLGNFHPQNPDKALMDYALDWKLIHRTEEDMNRLFESSKFAAPCTEIRFEEAGVNLFAFGRRS